MLDPATGPLISVLIPCFNEEKVIVASVRRILASNWAQLEVLVLDDGSTDGTADVVRKAFARRAARDAADLRERRQGARRSTAAWREAKGDVVVALDADTLFPPDTIGQLVRWFADPAGRRGGRQRPGRQPAAT